jgi:hypothetical protein
MSLLSTKQFTAKNGEFPGSIVAHQSGYPGGAPARVNSAGEIARAYSDAGYIGLYRNGSNVNQSGAPVTYYFGPAIFTMGKLSGESDYPYNEDLTYTPGNDIGVVGGEWSNASPAVVRARVLGVGSVSGGKTTTLTLQFI